MEENKNIQNDELETLTDEENKNNELETLVDEESAEEVVDEKVSRENEIEYRILEINVLIDEYQSKLYDEEIEIMTPDEYSDLLEEQKSLKKELKELRKETHTTFWDKVPVWQLVYGVIQFFICLPVIGGIYQLCMLVYNKLYEWFGDSLANLNSDFAFFLEVVMILAFPIINIFISWVLFVNVVRKKRLDRTVFLIIWIGQIVLTIISMLFVFIG